MDYKSLKASESTITRNIKSLKSKTGNIYEVVSILSKRANQISVTYKQELENKLKEVINTIDTLDEVYENREQIELSRFYERLPHATLVAIEELKDDKVYFRNPLEEDKLS